jgi:hypothetical protein
MLMGTPHEKRSAYSVSRPQGDRKDFDMAEIARELARLQTGADAQRVLFDWSQLRSWRFIAPTTAAIREWNATTPEITRAAFIHDRKWDRHVALLSALLRVKGAEVRSFRCVDAERAAAWLNQTFQEDDPG